MTELCRLCAESKDLCEIVASINDVGQSMEQKLRACCQWTTENTEHRLPHGVCAICLDKLDKCWLFAQSVQLAQQRLLEIFENNTECDSRPLAADLVQTVYDSPECSNNFASTSGQRSFRERKQKAAQKCVTCSHEFHTVTELNAHRQHGCQRLTEIDSIFVDCKSTAGDFTAFESDVETSDNQAIDDDGNDDDSNAVDEHSTNPKENANKPERKKPANKTKVVQNKKKSNKSKPSDEQRSVKKKYACDKCDRVYSDRSGLSHHRHVHTGARPIKCPLCEKSFRKKSFLPYHLITHVNRSKEGLKIEESENRFRIIQTNGDDPIDLGPRIVKCTDCDKIYTQMSELKVHRLRHSNDRSFECWLCHKTIKRWITIRNHLKYHVNAIERNWICDSCGKAFKSNNQLMQHARMVHSDERPYKCTTCGLGFKLSGLLTKHQRTHIESQFKCDQCGKQFRSNKSLNYHLESHTGAIAKPFVCDLCGNTFRMNRHLQDHRRTHTGEKPYSCELCTSCFRARNQFSTHMQKVHGISLLARNRQKMTE